jgi:hypothetical protein
MNNNRVKLSSPTQLGAVKACDILIANATRRGSMYLQASGGRGNQLEDGHTPKKITLPNYDKIFK